MNRGMEMPTWNDIVGLDRWSNEKCNGIKESHAHVASLVEHKTLALGLPH
jgi:hypothetical protein